MSNAITATTTICITLLITTPAVLGISQRFRPHCSRIRLFYGSMLISLAIATQVAFVYLYQFLQIGFLQHQVATVDELVADGFALMGSAQVQRLIRDDQKVDIKTEVDLTGFFHLFT